MACHESIPASAACVQGQALNQPEHHDTIAAGPSLPVLARQDGTAASGFVAGLCMRQAATRDLSDAVHGVCLLHGHHPGLIDHVAARADPVPDWLAEAVPAFAAQRAWLARLVAAAGPLPSTPGQAEAEAAIAGQRRAFEALAQSGRAGCSLGAAATLLLDWAAIHRLLVAAAARFGVEPLPASLPEPAIAQDHARAALFAAHQVLAQHRGLWQLLESRAVARNG